MKDIGGFSLIEMMIVMAIMAILSTMALPSFSNYLNKARVMEALTLSQEAKYAVSIYYFSHGHFPVSAEAAGVSPIKHSKVVSSVTIEDGGRIVVAFSERNKALSGKTWVFSPAFYPDGDLKWDCTGGTLPGYLRPAQCRGS